MNKRQQLQSLIEEKNPIVRMNKILADKKIAETVGKMDFYKGEKGDTGPQGKDGKEGKQGPQGLPSFVPGPQGKDGYTPIKYVDYYTPSERVEMISTILDVIPKPKKEIIDINKIIQTVKNEIPRINFKEEIGKILTEPGLRMLMHGGGIAEAPIDSNTYGRKNGIWDIIVSGAGDVVGPAGATTNHVVLFDGASGKLIKDSGLTLSGTNTGDNATNSQYSGLASSKQDALNGTGFIKISGTTISYDNSTYLTSVGTGTINELTYWSGANTLGTLAVATYPSLTELSYVKGVTSAIQTQLGARLPLAGGTMTGNLLFTDNTLDIGASGATRPRTGYFGTSLVVPTLNGISTLTLNSHSFGTGTGSGSAIWINAGYGGSTGGVGGNVQITAGDSLGGTSVGGSIIFSAGNNENTGNNPGKYEFLSRPGYYGIVNFDSVDSTDKTFTFPNVTGTISLIANTETLTNKRITQRVITTTDDATAVIDIDITDVYELSAVANATTFTLTGTPTDGQKLIVRFKDAGVAKGLTWTGFTAIGITLPTTTVASKWAYVGCTYNLAATTWHAIAYSVEA